MNKVTIFLKSGQILKFTCKDWKFDYNNQTLEYIGYEFTEVQKYKKVSIVPSQIAAYTIQ